MAVVRDEAAGEAAGVEPRRAGRTEEQRSLRGDVRHEAAASGDGHVAPRPVAGRPVRGSIRWFCGTPAASQRRLATLDVASPPPWSAMLPPPGSPTTTGSSAATSPPAETQPAPGERERVVDRLALDDAVQVELHRLGAQSKPPPCSEIECHEGTARRDDRADVRGEAGEVAVVAGGDDRATDGRRHEPVGGASRVDREGEHRRELLRDERQAQGQGVDARELGGRVKSAEARVALVEERPHGLERHPEREHDLAAHRAEGVHDAPDWTCGAALPDGADVGERLRVVLPKKVESSEVDAVVTLVAGRRRRVWCAGMRWPGRPTANAASAAAEAMPIA